MKFKVANFILLLWVSALVCSCTNQEELYSDSSSASLLRIAESMQKSRDFETAKKLYQQILETSPNHIEARLGLSTIYTQEGKSTDAINLLEETLKLHPQNSSVLKALGKAYISTNNGEKGEKIYKQLYALQPEDVITLNGLGICSDLKSQHSQAQTWYRKALEKDPNNISVQSNFGLSLALEGRVEEGIKRLTQLSQQPKATPNVKHNLAVAYALAGDNQKANEYFKGDLDQDAIQKNINFLSSLTSHEAASLKIEPSKLEPLDSPKASTKTSKKKKTINRKRKEASKKLSNASPNAPDNSSRPKKLPAKEQPQQEVERIST